MNPIKRILLTLVVVMSAGAAVADTMPLSEIRRGMKGYGLTVFEGKKVERFDVEIIGVMTKVAPEQDIIIARVASPVTDRAGVAAGMSGSPIYIDGKVIGALAYGWQFAKESICGITPIDEMLKIARGPKAANASVASASPRITAVELLKALADAKPETAFEKLAAVPAVRPLSGISGARAISIPLSLSSFAPDTIERFAPMLDRMGFVAVPSGAAAGGTTTEPLADAKRPFAPGDPIGAVLLSGDFNVAATGTVTHVAGDHIYAFGHPFLDMGEIDFPMATSEIVTVLPSLASSFKMANTGRIVGALRQDRASGIMGVVGDRAATIPVELTLGGNGAEKTYRVSMVRHPQLSPLILAMATDTVVANAQRAAGERTVMLEAEIRVKGFDPIVLREGWAGPTARQSLAPYIAVVSGYLMSNEFRDASIESVKLRLRHDDAVKTARLLEASVVMPERGRIVPGDKVKVRTLLKPFRGEAFTETFEIDIPENQRPGPAYLLIGSGTVMNQVDFSLVPPDPRTLEQVLAVLHRLRPSTDLTVGLYSTGEGAVTAGVYLPNLPPTMNAIVTADTSNGAQAIVKYHAAGHRAQPVGYIVDGSVKIDLDIKPDI